MWGERGPEDTAPHAGGHGARRPAGGASAVSVTSPEHVGRRCPCVAPPSPLLRCKPSCSRRPCRGATGPVALSCAAWGWHVGVTGLSTLLTGDALFPEAPGRRDSCGVDVGTACPSCSPDTRGPAERKPAPRPAVVLGRQDTVLESRPNWPQAALPCPGSPWLHPPGLLPPPQRGPRPGGAASSESAGPPPGTRPAGAMELTATAGLSPAHPPPAGMPTVTAPGTSLGDLSPGPEARAHQGGHSP